jgi:hypothetical protein
MKTNGAAAEFSFCSGSTFVCLVLIDFAAIEYKNAVREPFGFRAAFWVLFLF